MSGRLTIFDSLRGIAIISVILYHYLYGFNQLYGHAPPPPFYFSLGYLGVDLFFIISGFFIAKRLERQSAWQFAWFRFTRLFPVYWVAIVIIFFVVSFAGLPGREVSWREFMIGFTMLQHWMGLADVDGAFWILPVELSFYGLVFTAALINKKRLEIFSLSWTALGLVLWFIPESVAVKDLRIALIFFKYAHLFAAGIIFASWDKRTSFQRWALLFFLWLAHLLFFGIGESLIVGVFFIVMRQAVNGGLGFLESRFMAFTGLISYELYLIHSNIGYVIIRWLKSLDANIFLTVIVPTAASYILAVGLYYGAELPARKYLRRLWRVKPAPVLKLSH